MTNCGFEGSCTKREREVFLEVTIPRRTGDHSDARNVEAVCGVAPSYWSACGGGARIERENWTGLNTADYPESSSLQ